MIYRMVLFDEFNHESVRDEEKDLGAHGAPNCFVSDGDTGEELPEHFGTRSSRQFLFWRRFPFSYPMWPPTAMAFDAKEGTSPPSLSKSNFRPNTESIGTVASSSGAFVPRGTRLPSGSTVLLVSLRKRHPWESQPMLVLPRVKGISLWLCTETTSCSLPRTRRSNAAHAEGRAPLVATNWDLTGTRGS